MPQTEEEKQAAEDAKAQKAALARVAELEKQLEEANKRADDADAKVTGLEEEIIAARMTAPAPLPQGGTVTVDASGKVIG